MGQEKAPSHGEEPNNSSTPLPPTPATAKSRSNSDMPNPITPSSEKIVILYDWWLLRVETDVDGKKLAVKGFTSKGQLATRVFSSAPIIKRHNAFTLETADGITVMIEGFINKVRAHSNGFSPKVCNAFLIGFPYNWEFYAVEFSGNTSMSMHPPESVHGVDEQPKHSSDSPSAIFPIHLDEFPMNTALDFLNSTSKTSIDDVLKKSSTPIQKRKFDDEKTWISLCNVLLRSSSLQKRKLDDEQTTNSAGLGIRRISNDLLLRQTSSHPMTGSQQGAYALQSRNSADMTRAHSIDIAEGEVPDEEVTNPFSAEMNDISELVLESGAIPPHEFSNGKENCPSLSPKSSLKKNKAASSSSAVCLGDEDQYLVEGDQRGVDNRRATTTGSFGDSEAYSLNEINEVATVDSTKKTSQMGAGLPKEPSSKSSGCRRKEGFGKQKNIQDKTGGNEKELGVLGRQEHSCSRLGGYNLRSRVCAQRMQVHITGVAEGNDSGVKVAKSFSVKIDEPSRDFLESDSPKTHEISNVKENEHTLGSKFSSTVVSSAVPRDDGQYFFEGLANDCFGIDTVSGGTAKVITEEHSYQKDIQSEDLDELQSVKNKADRKKGKTIWRPSYSPALQTTQTRDMAKKYSISSPELLNLKRSRSGRLLVPPIARWCQEIKYDMVGLLTCCSACSSVRMRLVIDRGGEHYGNYQCGQAKLSKQRKQIKPTQEKEAVMEYALMPLRRVFCVLRAEG